MRRAELRAEVARLHAEVARLRTELARLRAEVKRWRDSAEALGTEVGRLYESMGASSSGIPMHGRAWGSSLAVEPSSDTAEALLDEAWQDSDEEGR